MGENRPVWGAEPYKPPEGARAEKSARDVRRLAIISLVFGLVGLLIAFSFEIYYWNSYRIKSDLWRENWIDSLRWTTCWSSAVLGTVIPLILLLFVFKREVSARKVPYTEIIIWAAISVGFFSLFAAVYIYWGFIP